MWEKQVEVNKSAFCLLLIRYQYKNKHNQMAEHCTQREDLDWLVSVKGYRIGNEGS